MNIIKVGKCLVLCTVVTVKCLVSSIHVILSIEIFLNCQLKLNMSLLCMHIGDMGYNLYNVTSWKMLL
jgi:hypothetical protein